MAPLIQVIPAFMDHEASKRLATQSSQDAGDPIELTHLATNRKAGGDEN